MEKQVKEEQVEQKECTGEELLQEYYNQDKEDKHHMGYSIYTKTDDGCCC